MHVDEVTIVQQPRGSYVLEVFHGFVSVGGMYISYTVKLTCTVLYLIYRTYMVAYRHVSLYVSTR